MTSFQLSTHLVVIIYIPSLETHQNQLEICTNSDDSVADVCTFISSGVVSWMMCLEKKAEHDEDRTSSS
jgi:hypothetical protein